MFSDNHDVPRLINKVQNPKHLYHIAVLVYTLPGIPSIYYGSEFGIEGVKDGTDHLLRPCLELSDFKDQPQAKALEAHYKKLGRLKKKYPQLTEGTYEELFLTTKQFAYGRILDGKAVVVCLNNAEESADMEFSVPASGENVEILLGGANPEKLPGRVRVHLEGQEFCVFSVS